MNKYQFKLWVVQAVGFAFLGFVLAWWVRSPSPQHASEVTPASESVSAKPMIWTCAMHPQIRRDGPGKCPICAMDLVPVKASSAGVRTISISDDIKKLMEVEVSPIQRRYVTAEVRMVGKIEYDETRLAHITAWVPGRLERMFVDFTGVAVKEGDHMVQIYSEELNTAQQELLTAINSKATEPSSRFLDPVDLAESAREKLRLLGLKEEQIQEIEQRRTPSETVTIYSPVGGVVVQKMKQEGDRVQTGDRIYTVADLSHLWVMLDAYESDLAWLRYGQDIEFTTEAYPGELFRGRIAFIDPVLSEATRTVNVRVNVDNEDGRLKPEMFVRALVKSQIASGGRVLDPSLAGKWISPMHPEIIKDEPGNCDVCGMPLVRAESMGYVTAEPSSTAKPLVVPVSAVLRTGTRAIVYVQIPQAEKPTFEGREIVIGSRAGDFYLVKSGLSEGDLVVTNGNFKLDSALQIEAKPSMMMPPGGGAGGEHQHGDMPTAKQETDANASHSHASHAMPQPSPVLEQMDGMLHLFGEIRSSIESANLEEIRIGYKRLGDLVAALPTAEVSPEMRPQWIEVAMLLRNDAVEGSEVRSMSDADRVFSLTKQHVGEMTRRFSLSMPGEEPGMEMMVELEVPAEVLQQIEGLTPLYLRLGDALAADQFDAAAAVASQLRGQVASWQAIPGDAQAIQLWSKEKQDLSQVVERLLESRDLAAMRNAFALLSESTLSIEQTFGLPFQSALYRIHCPMAFEGRGASWIQSDDAVRNPYYGAVMFRCADRVEKLPGKQ